MLAIALLLIVAAVVLFIVASTTSGAGHWLTLCSIGAGLLAAAGSFVTGWFVVGALGRRD
jgi:hypothetical protein